MDINRDNNSINPKISNNNIVLSNNYSGCNINYFINYLVSNSILIN